MIESRSPRMRSLERIGANDWRGWDAYFSVVFPEFPQPSNEIGRTLIPTKIKDFPGYSSFAPIV